jgi:transcriptional regulator with XRE-family HTH domain
VQYDARNVALAGFLRDRRGRVEPKQVGLVGGERRRVAGLRREEVAQLAGLSVDYYARLEQGRQRTASAQALRAVGRALCLTDDERRHLFTLAGVSDDPAPEALDEAAEHRVRGLVAAFGDTPALVVGPFVDIVHANPAASFLFTDFAALPAPQRNGLYWLLFADEARSLYGEGWRGEVEELVGMMRLDAGNDPRSERLRALVSELSEHSPLFRQLWKDQTVSSWHLHRKTLTHPAFGAMGFTNEFITAHSVQQVGIVLMVPDDPERFAAAMPRA